jgi:hypothetical protein
LAVVDVTIWVVVVVGAAVVLVGAAVVVVAAAAVVVVAGCVAVVVRAAAVVDGGPLAVVLPAPPQAVPRRATVTSAPANRTARRRFVTWHLGLTSPTSTPARPPDERFAGNSTT